MGVSFKSICLAAALAYAGLVSPRTTSVDVEELDDFVPETNVTMFPIEPRFLGEKRAAGDFELRIMPLGASIMSGLGSSGNGGSRRYLRAALRKDGWEVNMVGNQHTSSMKDEDHEAIPGDVIDQVRERFKKAAGFKPNIVLINAGTNDATRAVDVKNAGRRMEALLDDIWKSPGMGSTCVFLSTLLPTSNAIGAANRLTINYDFRELVNKRAGQGDCIYLAEMATTQVPAEEHEIFTTSNPDLFCAPYFKCDRVHPNNEGHKLMAAIFHQAINTANRAKKLKPPSGDFEVTTGSCEKHAGSGVEAGGLTQRGSGASDGIYLHDSKEMPVRFEGYLIREFKSLIKEHTKKSQFKHTSKARLNLWRFARLFNQGYDDLLACLDGVKQKKKTKKYDIWVNSADKKGNFAEGSMMLDTGINCDFGGINFLDMNADGLDDLVCVFEDGHIEISINQGDGSHSARKPPSFKVLTGKHQPAGKVSQDRVILGDIDGDGRGDYGAVQSNGEIKFWRNDGGVADKPRKWQALGVRSQNKKMSDQKSFRLEDINGDGRDDLLWVGKDGETTTWTNSRSCKKGKEGDGLNVAWRQGFYHGQTGGPTHYGLPGEVQGSETIRDRIYFARIYGDTPITGNLAKQDFVYMQHRIKGNSRVFTMRVWKNTGYGGTKLLADGNKYCNILGHKNGAVDYVWTWGGGDMQLWASRGKKSITANDPDGWWDYRGYMWRSPREMSRRDLHLADWDGDGRCDIIYADPQSGAVEVYINDGDEILPKFNVLNNPAPQLKCSHKNGLGLRDVAVRFADLTGNGRADYLCMAPDGRTTGLVQGEKGGFTDVGQIKMADGYDRANYQWTDVDGDGKSDLLWVEKFSGDGYVWYNEKQGKPGEFAGSAFSWKRQSPPDRAYAGQVAGTCEHYVDMNGDGRADIHYILGTFTNEARTSLSPSCGLSDTKGGDDPYEQLPDPPNKDPEDPDNPGGGNPPSNCIEGTGDGALELICKFTCRFGFCPKPCRCEKHGPIGPSPAQLAGPGTALPGPNAEELGPLCNFACRRLFCPSTLCQRAKGEADPCDTSTTDASAWADSGAEKMVESFMINFGTDDWFNKMQDIFTSDKSALQCSTMKPGGGVCPTPEDGCSQFSSRTYYYVRLMAHRINAQFLATHHALTLETLRDGNLIGSMVSDFKTEITDDRAMNNAFLSVSSGLAMAGTLVGAFPAAGVMLGMLGGTFALIGVNVKPPDDIDFENIKEKTSKLLINSFDSSIEVLGETLQAIFGEGGDSDYLKQMVKNVQPDAPGQNDILKLLYGGHLFTTVKENEFDDKVTKGVEGYSAAILGSVLSGLHYFVVGVREMSESDCKKAPAAYWGAAPIPGHDEYEACHWLVSPAGAALDSKSISDEKIKKLKDDYGIKIKDLVTNVALCHNRKNDNNGGHLYTGPEAYPPCFFGLPFVDAEDALIFPIYYSMRSGSFKDQYPGWLKKRIEDHWNDPYRL